MFASAGKKQRNTDFQNNVTQKVNNTKKNKN